MGELLYLWTIAQIFWAYAVKAKPLSILSFLLVHAILLWVIIANRADLEPIIRYRATQYYHSALFTLVFLWGSAPILLLGKKHQKSSTNKKT